MCRDADEEWPLELVTEIPSHRYRVELPGTLQEILTSRDSELVVLARDLTTDDDFNVQPQLRTAKPE